MTTHLEAAKKRIARVREEFLARYTRSAPKYGERAAHVKPHNVVITMDVKDGIAQRVAPDTVRDAIEGLPEDVRPTKWRAVLRHYYDEQTRGQWGPPIRDDSFAHFNAVLQSFPDDLHDKYVWCNHNSPLYNRDIPDTPLYHAQHDLLLRARGVGPQTILAMKRLFCSALEESEEHT